MIIPFINNFLQPNNHYPFFIKDRTDIIFVHITKNAGTSIAKAFNMNPITANTDIKKHYTASQIYDLVGSNIYNDAYKFSVVRNPWDRMLSYFFFRKRTMKKEFLQNDFSFEDWLLYLDTNNLLGGNYQLGRSQFDWLSINNTSIELNKIIKFETLEQEVKVVANTIGIKLNELEKINSNSQQVDYKNYYNTTTKNIISKYYQKDIDVFKYCF